MEPKHIALGLGVVGGAMVAPWAYRHLFVEGLTPEEKKNMLGFGVVTGTLLVASQFGWDEWLTIEGLSAKLEKIFEV